MKFIYLDKVKVTEGFYKSQLGEVLDYKYSLSGSLYGPTIILYQLKLTNSHEVWVHEDYLSAQ